VWAGSRLASNTGGAAPEAPTNVNLLLQGMSQQGDCVDQAQFPNGAGFPSNRFQGGHVNQLTCGWLYPAGAADSFDLQRSVDQSAYTGTVYDSITESSAGSGYSNYVTNSGTAGAPHIGSSWVNYTYTDTAATQCVSNSPPGSGPAYFSSCHGYGYRVRAVKGGVAGPWSAPMVATYYGYGTRVLLQDVFDGGPNYADAGGGTTPSGSGTTMSYTSDPTGFNTFINPYCGYGAVEWNLCVKQFNYMLWVAKAAQASTDLSIQPEIVGDYSMKLLHTGGPQSIQLSSYGSLVNGSYVSIKVPLADLMTDYTSGSGVLQTAWYKATLNLNANSQKIYWDWLGFVEA